MDAGPPPDPGIYCGTEAGKTRYCKVGTQDCCAVQGDNGGGSDTTYKCVSPAAVTCTGDEAITIPCSDSGQCTNGQVCCGTTDQAADYGSVACVAPSACTGETQFVFCDPNAQNNVCATLGSGFACVASEILPGYYVCDTGQ